MTTFSHEHFPVIPLSCVQRFSSWVSQVPLRNPNPEKDMKFLTCGIVIACLAPLSYKCCTSRKHALDCLFQQPLWHLVFRRYSATIYWMNDWMKKNDRICHLLNTYHGAGYARYFINILNSHNSISRYFFFSSYRRRHSFSEFQACVQHMGDCLTGIPSFVTIRALPA